MPRKGYKQTEEHKQNVKLAQLTSPEELSKKMSEIRKKSSGNLGKKHSIETKNKMSKAHKGKKLSGETKEKLRFIRKGKKMAPFSEEARKNMGRSHKGNKNHFIDGRGKVLSAQKLLRKNKCEVEDGHICIGRLEQHHEPSIDYNSILVWEGRLLTVCTSLHKKFHSKSCPVPNGIGIPWNKENTKKIIGEF